MRKPQAAFSLVEVTLAIGVVAFAFISVFGLVPTGLNTFRQAIDASVGSQIAQLVINDIQQTDFNMLVSSSSTGPVVYRWPVTGGTGATVDVRYFDDQGKELQDSSRAIYQVNTRVNPVTAIPQGASYSNLATVTIQIASNPGHRTLSCDPNTKLWPNGPYPMSTYSTFVARNINQ